MVDTWHIGTTTRQSAEVDIPIVDITRTLQFPGGAGNVKKTLSNMGCTVHTIVKSPTFEVKNRLVCDGVQIARWDTKQPFSVPTLDMLNDPDYTQLKCDALVISDYCKGTINDTNISILRQISKRVPTFIDTKRDPAYFNMSEALFFPNEAEYNLFPSYRDYFHLVTNTEGATLLYKQKYKQKYLSKPINSVCGAGDVVVAAYAAQTLSPDPVHTHPADFAMAAAACAIEKPYTVWTTREETIQRLKEFA